MGGITGLSLISGGDMKGSAVSWVMTLIHWWILLVLFYSDDFPAHLLGQTSIALPPSLFSISCAESIFPFISIQLLHHRRLFSTFVSTAVPTSSSFILERNGAQNRCPKYSTRPNSLYASHWVRAIQIHELIARGTVGGMFLFPGSPNVQCLATDCN